MKLTAQLRAEMETIQTRCVELHMEFLPIQMELLTNRRISSVNIEICRKIMEELIPCKVRLENILCETDIKEQGH